MLLVPNVEDRAILLVEDDLTTCKSIELMLRHAGFKDVTVTDLGLEAIDLLELHAPKYYVVILDLNLPDTNGFEVFKRLGEKYPAPIAVIFLTGDDATTTKTMAYELTSGNVVEMEYMTKPFHPELLISRLRLFQRSIYERRETMVMLSNKQDSQAIEQIKNEITNIRIQLQDSNRTSFLSSLGHDVLKGAIVGIFAVASYYGLSNLPFDRIASFLSP